MLNLNTSVFHDYDIRGIYPTEINEEYYYHLGKAIAKYLGEITTIGVGHDARLSSSSLTKSLIEGLTDYGVNIVFYGQISTELNYYAAGKYQLDANVIVTASHNPSEYNGLKMVTKGVVPLHGTLGLPEIKVLINEELPKAETKGVVTNHELIDEYIEYARTFVNESKFKKLKVVVDAGNGMGGPVWEKLIGMLNNIEIIPLYLNPDGNFPNHLPDPLKGENMDHLIKKVQETGADLGFAIDGDSDRIFFVDENGTKLSGTVTTAIFAEHFIVHEGLKGNYLYNASIGRIVAKTIESLGSNPIKTRGGHSFIKEKMKEHNGVFAGEHSGHYFLRTFWNAESPLIMGLLMLQILSERNKKLSELREQFDLYPMSGEINFIIDDKKGTIEYFKETFKDSAISIDEIDGASFLFEDFWFIVRPSNTEPLLRLNMDADNEVILKEKLEQIISIIEERGGVRK